MAAGSLVSTIWLSRTVVGLEDVILGGEEQRAAMSPMAERNSTGAKWDRKKSRM